MSGKVYRSEGLSLTLTAGTGEGSKIFLSAEDVKKLNTYNVAAALSKKEGQSLFIKEATKRGTLKPSLRIVSISHSQRPLIAAVE